MVKQLEQNGRTLFVCEECGMAYEEKKWAEKCQVWCAENHTCHIEITAHAVPLEY